MIYSSTLPEAYEHTLAVDKYFTTEKDLHEEESLWEEEIAPLDT